ncbi:hypothetical protein DFS34DRAFT_623789 [Phlyctochytrium arcticum]|nr:hypothetical protein DFS34DRAFT_623789 [Phlyctochytrium arcticum]
MLQSTLAALFLVATAAFSVDAHASCNPAVGTPKSNVRSAIRIPHGCGKNATNRVVVKFPESVASVKPQLIPTWNIKITNRPLATPIQTEGGAINETIDTVEWSGNLLSNDYYMDFGFQCSLPDVADGTPIYFETTQYCENNGVNYWNGTIAPKVTVMRNGTLLKFEDMGWTQMGLTPAGVNTASSPATTASPAWTVAIASAAGAVASSMLYFL